MIETTEKEWKKRKFLKKKCMKKNGISHSLLNFAENEIAEYDGKEESNTVDYTTGYLFSDRFYLLWLSIKYISQYYFSKWPPGDLFKSLTKKNWSKLIVILCSVKRVELSCNIRVAFGE